MANISQIKDTAMSDLFPDSDSNIWQSAEKIPLVIKQIEALKADMKEYLKGCDFNIEELAKESDDLCEKSVSIVSELENCKREIEVETMAEVLNSIQDHDIITEDLERVHFTINIVYDIVQCGKYFKDYEEYRRHNKYRGAVEILNDFRNLVECTSEGVDTLTIFQNFKGAFTAYWDDLMQELTIEWEKMFSYSKESFPRRNIMHININIDESDPVVEVLLALDVSKQLKQKIADFGAFLMENVLVPIMHQDCTVFEETEELCTINVSLKTQNKPRYDHVIANLRLLFYYLSKRLSFEVKDDKTLMTLLGEEISAEFSDTLIKDCLIETIPNSMNELLNYGIVLSDIESFQRFLTQMNFFPKENFSILQFANNLDVLFANKTSQYFLESARTIMLKDLSASMSIGVESVTEFNDKDTTKVDEVTAEALKMFDKAIPKSLFFFPRCMISKTAQELLDLVFVMMEHASQCSDLVSKRLYMTSRLIFEMYDAVVPHHHENYLQTIPQYVALFHNNCMFLAHNMLTLGEKWIMLMDGRTIKYPISFIDLVQKMRNLGYKHLTIHMQQQRKQILDNIRSSDLNCIVVKDVLGENAEQAIRQCLRQLQLLKNVWIGVFPANVFTRLMATLTNMFIEEIIHRVCTVEDISADMATQLVEIYTIVVKKAPNLFQKEADIEEHLKCWIKLQELILVLGGSLKDIEKRWNDGTGPLAIHFKTEELRNLIKALFQNTQFRANLLSKIK